MAKSSDLMGVKIEASLHKKLKVRAARERTTIFALTKQAIGNLLNRSRENDKN
jgi:hypothetical protein